LSSHEIFWLSANKSTAAAAVTEWEALREVVLCVCSSYIFVYTVQNAAFTRAAIQINSWNYWKWLPWTYLHNRTHRRELHQWKV